MATAVSVSERALQGFAVAALAHRDHDAQLAARGLHPDSPLHAAVTRVTEVAADSASRRAFLRDALQPIAIDAHAASALPGAIAARARGLIASRVAPELGRAWLNDAPMPRPGFSAEPELLELLAKLLPQLDPAHRERRRDAAHRERRGGEPR